MFAAIVGQSWADDAHPFNLEINGVDWITKAQLASIRIEMAGPGSNGSMSFDLEDATSAITINEWDEVRFIEHAATPRPILFGGFVQSVRYRVWARAGRTITVTCVGYGILLDKKVVSSYSMDTSAGAGINPPPHVQALVNRFGGRITAVGWDSRVGTQGFNQIDETYGIPIGGLNDWLAILSLTGSVTDPSVDAPTMLRSAIEYVSSISCSLDVRDPNFTVSVAEPFVYWVDSAAMFRVLPDLDVNSVNYDGGANNHIDQQWDSTVPGFAVDTAGTYKVAALEYEREDTDRVTSAYISGGAAPGSGYYRQTALERAGDLETIVSDSTSMLATDIQGRGGPPIVKTSRATASGSVTLDSMTPLAIWPGRHLTVSNAQANLDSSLPWRITGVKIAFAQAASLGWFHVYQVTFGGSVPQPSAMRRIGKMAFRTR